MKLLQTVLLVEINAHGIVEQILHSVNGTQYSVAYWHNGERKSAWVRDEELSEVQNGN